MKKKNKTKVKPAMIASSPASPPLSTEASLRAALTDMVGRYSARITALENTAQFHAIVLEDQGKVNSSQVAVNQMQEARNVEHDALHQDLDKFLDGLVDTEDGLDELDSDLGDVEEDVLELQQAVSGLEAAQANQSSRDTYELGRLVEICDYLNVERVATWEWNSIERRYDTVYVLVAKPPKETVLPPFFTWTTSIGS